MGDWVTADKLTAIGIVVSFFLGIASLAVGIWATALGNRGIRDGDKALKLAKEVHALTLEHHDVSWNVDMVGIDRVSLRNTGTSDAIGVQLVVRRPGETANEVIPLGDMRASDRREATVSSYRTEAPPLLDLWNELDEFEQALKNEDEDAARARNGAQLGRTLAEMAQRLGKPEDTRHQKFLDLAEYDSAAMQQMIQEEFTRRTGLSEKQARKQVDEAQAAARSVELALRWKSSNDKEHSRDFEELDFRPMFSVKAQLAPLA